MLFLQNIVCIEIYERTTDRIKLLQTVTKKNDCKTTHFIQNNLEYFHNYLQLVDRPNTIITSSDTISIISKSEAEHSKQDFLISYASGTLACFDVLQRFKTSSVDVTFLPLCGVAIPLQYLEHIPDIPICGLYTFLPLPIKSPLFLNINGYFSLSDSRKNLCDAITSQSNYTNYQDLPTEWNFALINDALPNALICALNSLPKINSTNFYNNYLSLWTNTTSTELLWKSFPLNLAKRIMQSPACIFSCAQSPTIWVAFRDVSFLFLELSLKTNAPFIQCIYELFIKKGIRLANASHSFFSTDLYKAFSELAPQKIFDLERIIKTVISPDLHNLSLSQIIIIMKAIIPLCIYPHKEWLFNWLSQTECIPCGLDSVNFKLNFPCKVVCPNTIISKLYYAKEMRQPVPELRQMFTFNDPNNADSIVLQRLGVISQTLPECEIIERCGITGNLEIGLAMEHSLILIEYLSRENSEVFNSVYPKIRSIRFIPTYTDEITRVLSSQVHPFAAPIECYSFYDRHLVTPFCTSACSEVKETAEVLKLFHNPSFDTVFQVLTTLIAQPDKIRDIKIDDKIIAIYRYISSSDPEYLPQIITDGKQWIWEPEMRSFYASDQVILSPYLMGVPKNKYLVSFPYRDMLMDKHFETYLNNVGIKNRIDDETIIDCFERIYNDYGEQPVDANLIAFILKLIDSIQNFGYCSEKVFLLSQLDILHRPRELYVNYKSHLCSFLNDECYSKYIVKLQIHPSRAFQLGTRSCEELFCTDDSEFGLSEEITDRIKGLIREMPIESVFKELIQNAEDAKATEMVFILDDQDYSTHTNTLVENNFNYPNLKDLHSYPSLNVYNNKGFSEGDIKGIQNLSVGGKTNDRNTIGKFGQGFNSVYHITNAPTFVSTLLEKKEISFCCFDPFLKYTNCKFQQQNLKRGLRRNIPFNNTNKFSDQLFPFKYENFNNNNTVNESLTNIRKNKEYTMFRFPLDIQKPETNTSILGTAYENVRISYSLENLETELLKVIESYPDILLFLTHLCSLKVLRIDKNRNVKLLSSLNVKPRKPILTELPCWFPLKHSPFLKIQEKENKSLQSDKRKWLIYSIPDIPIAEYVVEDPSLTEYSHYYSNEKLSGYGSVAVRISNLNNRSNYSNLFTFLPVGLLADFPVHINAALILDSSRQSVHDRKIDWEIRWHSSIIKLILVPLYTMLLLDLRDPRTVINDVSTNKKRYFDWYYSLFPCTEPKNIFLSEIKKTLYDFLVNVNPEILLADNLLVSETRIWYNLKGTNCGIFKPSSFFKLPSTDIDRDFYHQIISNHELRESEISKSLIIIKFPLTFAPLRLLHLFKSNELNPIKLLRYLNNNPKCVFRENAASNNLESMVLTFPQLLTFLEYILTDSKDYPSTHKIPLRIDLNTNLCDFDPQNPSFIPTFSSLLPHCAEHFISSDYNCEVIQKLLYIGYVRDLDSDYLAKHLEIESSSKCLIFWEYILFNKIDQNGLTQFKNHLLLPVYDRDDDHFIYYPISKLEFLLTSALEQNDKILFSALNKLGCPLLGLELFKSSYLSSSNTFNLDTFLTEIEKLLNPIAISTSRSSHIILGSIECSTLSSADLEPTESSLLLTLFSTLQPCKLSNNQLRIFSTLKIFKSINSKCFSLKEFNICFVNDHRIPIGTELFDLLHERHKLIVFQPTCSIVLQNFCLKLGKDFLDLSRLFIEYIFKYLSTLPFVEQNSLVSFIAGKLAENEVDYLPYLIDNLKQISFILNADGLLCTVNEFYCGNLPFVNTFLANYSLPEDWRGENLKPLFLKLGLQTSVSLDKLLFVANEFSLKKFESEKLKIFLVEFARILQNLNNFETNEIAIIQQISKLKFLPVWRYAKITDRQIQESSTLAKFSEAQLYENQHCCCCASWVHTYSLNLPDSSYEILNIQKTPPPDVVKQHLHLITTHILQQYSPPTQIPNCYGEYFRSSYEYFQHLLDSCDISLVEFYDVRCILWERQLFYPVNMLFTTTEGIKPFIIQLPSELSHLFSKFFECIGVKQAADYTHYSYVLKKIHRTLSQRNENLAGSSYEVQINIVFALFIKTLRSSNINEIRLDLDSTLVLTRNPKPKLLPCSEVVYADNQALLSRVTKKNIEINILKTLEPDGSNSCVPPDCLKLKRLSKVISENIDPIVNSYKITNTGLADYLEKKFNDPLFYRLLRRLFYHLTKKDLNNMRFKGFTIQDLLNNLKVESVKQIDININDKRYDRQYKLENACGCYICTNTNNNIFLLSDHHTMRDCIFKDIAFYLNTYLEEIFSEVLAHLEICIQLIDYCKIMEKLSEFNIDLDPWDLPGEIIKTDDQINTHPHSNFSNNYHGHMSYGTPFQPPRPEGISIGEPDPSAAKLSINVSQCNLLAAKHLITPIPPTNLTFPALSCFLSFEALINIFHALLHFVGSRNRLTTERNLRVYFNLISQVLPEDISKEIHMLTCSLMDYDFDTRYPSASLIPCLCNYIPQQLYSLNQAEDAIVIVNQIIILVTNTFPDLRKMLAPQNHQMFTCSTATSSPQLITRLPCIDMCQGIRQVALETDSSEFAAITRRFHQSMPYAGVITITKIINPDSWKMFEANIKQELPRFPNICLTIRLLFHGSSKTDPNIIIKDSTGFNMKFADRGLWGHGIYFAFSSSYAHRYCFNIAKERHCIFAASVLIGNSKQLPQNRSLTGPPPMPNGRDNYHSVQGTRDGELIHVVYKNSMAYPNYLITYATHT
ncbi:Sacsin-like [Oopsacas minuta]|uniref:Poly [ADP-ribose] polymerase n=1 Tax=Oopsacas minuta TaxID=111878 RepID=A0AAV7KIJ0_9METZ|nr:Sacsin-like [Oopsacas minuta]